MPIIKPFRDVNEHDVINLYAFSGNSSALPVSKGTFVKVIGSGWRATDEQLVMLGSVGSSYNNTVSQRYGVLPKVAVAASGDTPIGMMLYDVRSVDENGEVLLYNPRKQAEMQCVLSGQAVPIAIRGMFLYSGILGTVTAGQTLYPDDLGGLRANGAAGAAIATALGAKDDNGFALIKINI